MLLLAVLGALTLLGQVVLLRELAVAFYGAELVILLGVGLWLAGTGLGAALARLSRAEPWAGLLAFAFLLPGAAVAARAARILGGGVPGAYLAFGRQLAAMLLVMLPPALLAGWLFARAAARAAAGGRTLAAAYAVECAGALAGGAAATVLTAAGVGNLAQALGCGCGAAAAVAAGRLPWRRPATAAAALLLVAGASAPALDHLTTRWNHPDLLAVRDTPYGRVTVESRAGQIVVFRDDALAWENEGTAAEEFVQLAAVQASRPPRRVLVLGGGAAGLVAEARRLEPDSLVYVEMDRALLKILRGLPADLGLGTGGAGPAPAVVVADPRRWLAAARGWDLILVGAPAPASARDNRFYTREFFTRCASALAPDGVLALRLPAAANVWTPARVRQAAAVRAALADVFPSVVAMPASATVLLASPAPLPLTAAAPAARLAGRAAGNRLVTPAYLDYLYGNDRFADVAARLAAADAPANTDRRPACFRETLLLWTARFFPALGWRDLRTPTVGAAARSPLAWLAILSGVTAAALVRRAAHGRRVLALAAAGAAGMLLEASLLVQFQARVGALYRDLGVLLCLFMAGMAGGAWLIGRLRAADPRRREVAAVPAAATAVFALIAWGAPASLAATGAMMALGAAAVGAAFASLSRSAAGDGAVLASPLLAADLVGSSLGCLAAGLLVVPVWGPVGAAAMAAGCGLAAWSAM